MRTVTNDFKNTIKQLAVYSDGYVNLVNDSGTLVFDRDTIVSLQIDGSAYRNDKVLGSIAQHSLTLELLGDQTANINLSVENRLQAFVGVLINSAYEYVQYQDFLVTEVSYTDTTNITRVYATDYLVKLNREFIDGNDYSSPITLIDYATSVLAYCGLTLENTSFFNSTFSIESKPFEDYTSSKEIVERIAELALSFVIINKDNNTVEFKSAFTFSDNLATHRRLTTFTHEELSSFTHLEISNGIDLETDSLTKDHYWNLKFSDHNFGTKGVNTLVLGISQVVGENNTEENATNVAIDGAIEVRILDNPLINTEAKRISVLSSMFAEIDGFMFQPFTIEYRGFPYIDLGDVIVATRMDNSTIVLPIFETLLRYDGGLKGSLKSKSLNKVITSNKYISKTKQKLRNAEIKVDKVAGEIALITSEISDLDDIVNGVTANSAGITLTPTSITSTVTTSTTYTNDLAGKYDQSAGSTLEQTVNGISISVGKYENGELVGTKYTFDGTNATFTNGGLIIKNNANQTVFTADVNGNLDITGKITATSGKIGRLDINVDQNIYYESDLFAKQYDNSDVTRLRQILAGLITPTDYDNYVYDINNSGGALTVTDLVQLKEVVAGSRANPNKMIRSRITIGKSTSEIEVTSVSTGGHVGPSSIKMQGYKITGGMVNAESASIKYLTLNGLEVYSDCGTLKVR